MPSLVSGILGSVVGGAESTSSDSAVSTTPAAATSLASTITTGTTSGSSSTTAASASSTGTTSATTSASGSNTALTPSSSSTPTAAPTASTASTTGSSISSSASSTTSTISSTLTAALTTSVQATVISTNANGAVVTTIIETQTVLSAGSVVTSTSVSSSSNDSTASSSHTGAIVGGVVGGIGGIIVLLGLLFFILRRAQRKRELDEAFDGNFDPDRVVRAGGGVGVRDSIDTVGYAYAGGEKAKMKKQVKRASRAHVLDKGTLPDIPIDNDGSGRHQPPEMQQLMSRTSSRNNLLDEEGMDDDDGMGGRLNGTSIGGGIVTPYTLYHSGSSSNPSTVPPSPAPSSLFHNPTPSPYNPMFPLLNSASSDGHAFARTAKEREAFGGRPPSMAMSTSASMSGHGHPTYGAARPPSFAGSLYGSGNAYVGSATPPASPSPTGYGRSPSPGMSSAYANASAPPTQGRRYSSGPNAAPVPTPAAPVRRVMNPDADSSTPPALGSSSKSPLSPSTSPSAAREVLVHQDAGRVPDPNLVDVEGPQEVLPTYASLNAAASSARPVEKA